MRDRGQLFRLSAVALALLIVGLPSLLLVPPRASAAPGPLAPRTDGSAPTLTYHANLFVNDSAPTGTAPAGATISVEYAVQLHAPYSGAVGARLVIPPALVVLPLRVGTLHLNLGSVNLTVTGSGAASAAPGPATRVASGLSFNSSAAAFFSTQGVALTASWPLGGYTVGFEWRWVVTPANGTATDGPWSAWASVVPAQLVRFATPPVRTAVIGAPYSLCLAGPVASRTFSVHVSVATPARQLDDGSVVVPASVTSQFCWNSSLPVGVPPQQAFVHLWEYSNVTYLLSVLLVQLVNATATEVGGGGGGSPARWSPLLLAGAGVGVAVVAVELIALLFPSSLRSFVGRIRRSRRAPSEPTPPVGADELPPESVDVDRGDESLR